jgi:type IV secretory pathway protease TraF
MIKIEVPAKGFTKAERAWLRELVAAIKTVEAIQGKNVSITNSSSGQVINAADCQPCP